MRVKLKNVNPNPYRDMGSYPILRTKVDQLKKSIASTSFWDNIVAREDGKGGIQIAYGHHRLTALRELYDGEHELDFIVRDLDDGDMLKIMAHENLDEWATDSSIERETVRAVVKAYGSGSIALPKVNQNTSQDKLRYAPSFCFGINKLSKRSSEPEDRLLPYNADVIAAFLGGTLPMATVQYTLRALCLIEQGHLSEEQLKGLSSNQAREVVDEVTRSIKHAEQLKKEAEVQARRAQSDVIAKKTKQEAEKKAKAVIKKTASAVSETFQQKGSASEAKAAAREARASTVPQDRELPEINAAASRVAGQIHRLMDSDYDPAKKLEEIIKFKSHLSPVSTQNLIRALDQLIEYAEGYRASLR